MQQFVIGLLILVAAPTIACGGARKVDPADEKLTWSADPGCHERVLQRRYRNPLFPADRREVTATSLADAKEADQEALKKLRVDVVMLHLDLPDDFPVGAMAPWIERVNNLRYRSVEVGGEVEELLQELDRLSASMMKAWRAFSGFNQDVLTQLDEVERYLNDNEPMMMDEDIAQIRSCVPSEDIIPSLLMYDIETLRLFKRHFDGNPEGWRSLQIHSARIAKEVWDRGEDVPGLRERLEFIIQPEN